MYCSQCGTKMPEGARFCPNCGAAVEHKVSQPEAQAASGTKKKEKRTGLIVGICAGVMALIMLSCVVIGASQKKPGTSNSLHSSWDDDDWDDWEDWDDDWNDRDDRDDWGDDWDDDWDDWDDPEPSTHHDTSESTWGAEADEPQPEPEQPSALVVDPDRAILPDLGIFLQCGRGEDQSASGGWLVSYSFDMDEGESVIDDVLDLMLEPQYQLQYDGTSQQDFTSSSATLFDDYYYTYTGNASIENISILGDVCQLRLGVAHYYAEGRISISLYFSNSFTLVDPGKQLKYPPTDFSGKPVSGTGGGSSGNTTPEFAKLDCDICDGSGDCQTCGGDGYLWSSASGKEDRNCYKCRNHDGKCTYCNGTGKRN